LDHWRPLVLHRDYDHPMFEPDREVT